METSLNVYDYPEPEEMETKHINAEVCVSFKLEFDIPEDWDNEQIKNYIKENINDFANYYDQEIEDIIL